MTALFDVDVDAPEVPKATERIMLDALHQRYDVRSQGLSSRYAVAEHVRNDAGFSATRTADFVAMDLWPGYGKGLHLHGHEVKVSRSDWLTELKDPEKARAFIPHCNFWWLVVPDARIVKDDLPDGWGLLVLNRNGLRAKVKAPYKTAEPMPRGFVAAMLRATQTTATRRSAPWQDKAEQWDAAQPLIAAMTTVCIEAARICHQMGHGDTAMWDALDVLAKVANG